MFIPKIRIGYILTQLELGGAQKHVLSLIERLNPERFDTFLITSLDSVPLTPIAKKLLQERFIQVACLKREIQPVLDLKAGFEILSILKERSVDIVHTHSSKAGIIGRWSAWKAGVPHIVHTVHGFGFNPELPLWERRLLIGVEQKAAAITHRMIAVSKAVMEQGCRLNIGVRSQYECIPCGIAPNEFEQVSPQKIMGLKQELGIPLNSSLVTMVSCFKPQKAPLDFVKIAALVNRHLPEVHFLMVGEGLLRPQIEKERNRLGLAKKLILASWRWDIPVVLAASDVIVLTSRWEGLPMTLLEAMASQKPIVTTAVDGTPEIVQHGENGFLAHAGDTKAMASAVIQLLENPHLAETMGKRGKQHLTNDYDITETIRRLENLYEDLVLCPT